MPVIYAVYALIALALFRAVGGRRAAIACFIGGWLALPVGEYRPGDFAGDFPLDVLGLALPARMLLSKAALVPTITCVASLIMDHRRWIAFRPALLDAAVAMFCAWPLAQQLLSPDRPGALADAAYLTATWGATWSLGRLYIGDEAGLRDLLRGLAWSGLVMLPAALLEAFRGPFLYEALYGPHPYARIGIERYVGYRPVLLFEDGNQYGMWMAMAALAGFGVARDDRRFRAAAWSLAAASLLSQSVGAILLLGAGALAVAARVSISLKALAVAGALLVATAGVYVSGLIPVEHIARRTAAGQAVIGAFRSVGRGSLPWRVSQDLKTLPLIRERAIVGHGRWDWWKPAGARPWGLPMLVWGQFGLIGLALSLAILLAPSIRVLTGSARPARAPHAVAIITLAAVVDAALNSFIYFPAILASGALAAHLSRRPSAGQGEGRLAPAMVRRRHDRRDPAEQETDAQDEARQGQG